MTASLDTSLKVGGNVVSKMGQVSHLHSRRVEQAAFAVLKSPDIPSILVETGFISNPGEEKKLQSHSYQRQIARAIHAGIDDYFRNHPPPNTYLAWQRNKGSRHVEHVIASGDTLSGIAQQYQVSVASIREYNALSTSVIKVGQRLNIPAL